VKDGAGNAMAGAPKRITVKVKNAAEQLADLEAKLKGYRQPSLAGNIATTRKLVVQGLTPAACTSLDGFMYQMSLSRMTSTQQLSVTLDVLRIKKVLIC
jgi:hypothetical protein